MIEALTERFDNEKIKDIKYSEHNKENELKQRKKAQAKENQDY